MDALLPDDPDRIGPYRLEGRLGAGGMGEVFLARSPGGRIVVVKRIHGHHATDPEYRARFAREIDAARRVGGHFTAQVVAADPDADRPWMVTAHIPGPSLQAFVSGHGPLTADTVVALGAGLAEGLAAIHACGLVHRDLKPANVICADDGPRIIDFGIARPLDAGPLTETGALLGTCAYMSPEQLNGHPATPAADVFALGCVLGFAATGQGPFHAVSLPAIVRRVTSEDPDLSRVPTAHGLRDLVAACLAKTPADRPEVTDILARLARSGAGHHRPATPDRLESPTREPARTEQVSSRLPRRALLTAGLGVSGAIAVIAISHAFGGEKAAPSATPVETKVQAYNIGEVVAHEQGVYAVAFAPDGKVLATGGGGGVRLWDTTDPARPVALDPLRYDDWVATLAFNHDGTLLATGAHDGSLRLWDVAARAPVAVLEGQTGRVTTLAFTRDGTLLASGGDDETVRLWDVAGQAAAGTLPGHRSGIDSLAFNHDGTILASASGDPTVWLWNVEERARRADLLTTAGMFAVAFNPAGSLVAAGGTDPSVRLWDVARRTIVATMTGHTNAIGSLAFSPDGTLLASGGDDRTVRLWKVADGALVDVLTGPEDRVTSVAFSPDGQLLAVGSTDTKLRLWKIA
ncbi:WD40 repeat domain-containing serine/threonine protein kinase [Herbidospora sp. RD11066]